MRQGGRLHATALLLGAAWSVAATAAALAQGDEQVVYWPLVTDGAEYRRIAYPEEAGPLRVLAGTDAVIEARRAPVFYWPITREHLADFSKAREMPEGSLDIIDGSGAVTAVEPEPYVVWHPSGVGAGPAEIVRGEAAARVYDEYVHRARAAAEQAKEYQRIVAEHQAMIEAWLRLAGERRGQNMPAPPPELGVEAPEPYRAFATEPREGFVVRLPEGSYAIRLRGADGGIVPGSERQLVSFGPLNHAIGYVVRPENRWTQPVVSFAPDEVIYTTGETDIFFEPVSVAEYNARHFSRLFRPQSVESADPGLTVWVPRAENDDAAERHAITLWKGDERVGTAPRAGYRVSQIPDTPRGYTIEEFVPEKEGALAPDFHAMRVGQQSGVTKVELVPDADGRPVEASAREVRFVDPPATSALFLPVLLPLALGLAIRGASAGRSRMAARSAGTSGGVSIGER